MYVQVVEKFLTYAAQILAPEDPGKSDEESELKSRLDQLRQLLLLFNTNYVKLDDVNDLGSVHTHTLFLSRNIKVMTNYSARPIEY